METQYVFQYFTRNGILYAVNSSLNLTEKVFIWRHFGILIEKFSFPLYNEMLAEMKVKKFLQGRIGYRI